MIKRDLKTGFTLVEMQVALVILSVAAAMILFSITNMNRGIKRSTEIINSRHDVSLFTQGAFNFINNSYYAYLVDPVLTTETKELDYLNTTFTPKDPRLDKLYLIKDTLGNTATLEFKNNCLQWVRLPDAIPQIMLEDVYRIDAKWSADGTLISEGTAPIFKFPHKDFLYNVEKSFPFRPKFVIIQFRKLMVKTGGDVLTPITIPMTIMFEVNVSST